MHYFVGHVSCLGISGVILKNNKFNLGTLWILPRIYQECGRTTDGLHLTSANNLI